MHMHIRDIFEHDIDRDINGVVKVGDVDEKLVIQELEEYVVAKELQGHFATFFHNYERSIDMRPARSARGSAASSDRASPTS